MEEQKANSWAWTIATASLSTPLSWSGSPAASARGEGPIVSLDWPRNLDPRTAFATVRTDKNSGLLTQLMQRLLA